MNNYYKEYIKERQGCEFIETDYGFATYSIEGVLCYLQDMYVDKNRRREKLATEFGNMITNIAVEAGCKFLCTTIKTKETQDNYENLYAILSYGFKLTKTDEEGMYFIKRIQ